MVQEHIIIAENEEHTRLAISLILEDAGYKVTTAGNGREALYLIQDCLKRKERIDLLVTDLQMPILNGVELIDKILERAIPIPIVIITGYKDTEIDIIASINTRKFYDEFLNNDFNYLLEKPSNPEELIKSIESAINKFKQKQQNLSIQNDDKFRII